LSARRSPSLLARALALQARREHSRAELAQRLAPHAKDSDEVERTLDALASKGLLSESRFAEALVHRRSGRFGAARIRHELKDKGIAGDLLRSATAALAGSELDRARAVWRKKFGSAPASAAERARQMRFLAGRGFAAEVVHKVVGGDEE
jgi:regulatory protein